jgi:DNA-binding MarR family transcriptional regulator
MQTPKANWNTRHTAVRACLRGWQQGVRWRQIVEKELSSFRLTFVEWLVLDATKRMVRRRGDAVSQSQIAERTGLDRMTVSRAMTALDRRALVSRGPDMYCIAYRVFATEEGRSLADACNAVVEAASDRFMQSFEAGASHPPAPRHQ